MRSFLFYCFLLILIIVSLASLNFAAETDLVKSARLISCGYYLGSQTPERVADGDNSTYWSCGILHNQWGEHWLAFDFGGLAEITKFSVKHIAFANLPGTLNTQEYIIESGQSVEGPWHIVYSVHNNAQENQNDYIFPQQIQTRYIRLHIIKPNYYGREDNFARIAEIEFWGTKLQSNFNLIASVQAATPKTGTNESESFSSINNFQTNTPAKSNIQPHTAKGRIPNQSQSKVKSINPSRRDYSSYLIYSVTGLGVLIVLILLVSLIRWMISWRTTKKQFKQKQEAEQIKLQKQQDEERKKLEKQQAVTTKFQEYFDAGMKAMEEERYDEAAQAFYQAQGLRPDSTEAKSKLVYCKNLMKLSKGRSEQAA